MEYCITFCRKWKRLEGHHLEEKWASLNGEYKVPLSVCLEDMDFSVWLLIAICVQTRFDLLQATGSAGPVGVY